MWCEAGWMAGCVLKYPSELMAGWWWLEHNNSVWYYNNNSVWYCIYIIYYIWLVVNGTMEFWMTFHIKWEFHHPNWRSPSFFRGVAQPPTRIPRTYGIFVLTVITSHWNFGVPFFQRNPHVEQQMHIHVFSLCSSSPRVVELCVNASLCLFLVYHDMAP